MKPMTRILDAPPARTEKLWKHWGHAGAAVSIDDMTLDTIEASVRDVFNLFPTRKTPNESQTEEDLI